MPRVLLSGLLFAIQFVHVFQGKVDESSIAILSSSATDEKNESAFACFGPQPLRVCNYFQEFPADLQKTKMQPL